MPFARRTSLAPAALLLVLASACGPVGADAAGEPAPGASAPERGAPLTAAVEAQIPRADPGAAEAPAEPAPDAAAPGTEEPATEGALSITFRDLSLVGEDVNGLLDLMFEKEKSETTWTFPEQVQALDGKEVEIVGYMIPLEWKEDEVTAFMLVRDLAACCFGGMPRPDEWIDVEMAEGKGCEFFPYMPIRARGTLGVGLDRKEDALVASVFQMVATSVTKR